MSAPHGAVEEHKMNTKLTVKIIESAREKYGFYFRASCGKKNALIQVFTHGVHVVCENAMHNLRHNQYNSGKLFRDAEDAVASYKSAEMKTIIHAALAASVSTIQEATV